MKVEYCAFKLFFLAALVGFLVCPTDGSMPPDDDFKLSSYSPDFLFGAGSAAYQYEGAAYEDGRGPSIWDTFVQEFPEKISSKVKGPDEKYPGAVAQDFYHRYSEDIKLMKQMGLQSFRFSLSWSRILPNGTIRGGVNKLGVQFYNNLINELIDNKIEPFVTLVHFDTPQALEDLYGGLRSPMIVGDFLDYVDFCFETFGDRVKFWTTFNEPNAFAEHGYSVGVAAPGRCSNYMGNCPKGDSATEPYIVTHHILLCHAAAVNLYRQKYQPNQHGQIGITIPTYWYVPKYNTSDCIEAAERGFEFSFGWYANPVTYGDYPEVMKEIVGYRLPKFTEEESKMLKGSYDFLSINYYTSRYVEDGPAPTGYNLSYTTDKRITASTKSKDGVPIGTPTALGWLYICPEEFLEYLLHVNEKYNNPVIIVTENGMADAGTLDAQNGVNDTLRITYLDGHLDSLSKAMEAGVQVKGYYIWTLLDDFEWGSGYSIRFGLTYIDYQNNLTRYIKDSAFWFKNYISHNSHAKSEELVDETYITKMGSGRSAYI